MVDFHIINQGTMFLVQPLTEGATSFLTEFFSKGTGDHLYTGDALVVDHRYIDGIIEAINDNDLAVEE